MKRRGSFGIVAGAVVIGIAVGGVACRILFMPEVQAKTPAPPEVKVVTLLEQVTTTPDHPLVRMLRVDLPPGANVPHPGPGPVFGYILEGELRYQLEWSSLIRLKQGQVYYIPPEVGHLVADNPSSEKPTKLLYVLIGQRDKPAILPPSGPRTRGTAP